MIIFCVVVQKLLIAQVKMVLKVLFLYIPLPMFWALFDQQVTTNLLPHTMYVIVCLCVCVCLRLSLSVSVCVCLSLSTS